MDAAVERRLVDALGRGSLQPGGSVVMPESVEQVVAAVRICAESALPMTACSGAPAGPSRPADGGIFICLAGLATIRVDRASMTARAEAGATVSALRSGARQVSLSVVGLPARADDGHVGGMLARGEVPRRAVTGMDLVLTTGEVVRTGGAVLKDVTGYDLAGIVLGSMGRVAIIVAVHLRLQPAASSAPEFPVAGKHRMVVPALAGAFDPKGLLRARP